jgi:hypothetical protein
MTSLRRRLIGLAVLAVVVGIGTVLVMINGGHNVHRGAYAALTLGIGWGFTGAGLYVWRRRPGNNVGVLMTAVGFSGFLKGLTFSNNSAIFTIASLGEVVIYAVLVHLLLSFPSGRLESRLDRLLVAIAYFNTTVVQLAAFVFTDPAQAGCPHCPANPLLINHPEAATALNTAQVDIAVAVLGAVVAAAAERLVADVLAIGASAADAERPRFGSAVVSHVCACARGLHAGDRPRPRLPPCGARRGSVRGSLRARCRRVRWLLQLPRGGPGCAARGGGRQRTVRRLGAGSVRRDACGRRRLPLDRRAGSDRGSSTDQWTRWTCASSASALTLCCVSGSCIG